LRKSSTTTIWGMRIATCHAERYVGNVEQCERVRQCFRLAAPSKR
jgi:hypothetical protein